MTEAEWLACDDPQRMLEFLSGKASDRKLRLFAVACCRPHLDPENNYHIALDIGEELAEGKSDPNLKRDWEDWAIMAAEADTPDSYPMNYVLAPDLAKSGLGRHFTNLAAGMSSGPRGEQLAEQARLLRCIVGNPFCRTSVNPAWLTPAIVLLAQAAYDERLRPDCTLLPDRLAVLADALEEAGCTDADILSHLRGPGPHVRGCWALDLILGRE